MDRAALQAKVQEWRKVADAFQDAKLPENVQHKGGKRTEAQEATQWPIVRSVTEALERLGVR